MRKFLLLVALSYGAAGMAQDKVKLTKGSVPLSHVFEPDSVSRIQSGIYNVAAKYPVPNGVDPKIKYLANQKREMLKHNKYPSVSGKKRAAIAPLLTSGFAGAQTAGTPNDNNMAVNNDSFVVSVLNTYIRVYNTNGVFKKNWGLEFFPIDPKATKPGSGVGSLDRSYDPKVLFDPVANRFIIVFLEGSESSDTRIIVSYSKTSNPLDGWNVYQLNGNPYGGKFWTDYPMIAINGEDLFITVNILKDNTDWRDGFTQSVIWQMPTARGYNGDTLQYNLWSNIVHQGKSVWSICPVQDAYQPGREGLYFLSVRPGDAMNDTVFLHAISHNYQSGIAQYSMKVLKTDEKYGLPPVAPQKQAGFKLQTNDARVLGAFFANNRIQYVQTTNNSINGRSSVYHGIIQYPDHAIPTVSGKIISYDTLDIAYPTIVHAGNDVFGKQSLITFSHSGETVFPGTSVLYYDNNGEYSDLLMAKKGEGLINSFIADTAERWGDYTSIQRRYNNSKEFWLVGSYGRSTNAVGTWISKVTMNDPKVGLNELGLTPSTQAYPNPVSDMLTIPFTIPSDGMVSIQIMDATGKLVYTLSEPQNKGEQHALINLANYTSGIYFYSVLLGQQLIQNGSFSKQ
jgi:hypothetical protein